jgi:hypothetical protein
MGQVISVDSDPYSQSGGLMAKLSYQSRKKMKSSSFVFPKTRSYPIEDKKHAIAALQASHGARSGKPASSSKQAEIRHKVLDRYPSLNKTGKKKIRHHGGMVSLSSLKKAS